MIFLFVIMIGYNFYNLLLIMEILMIMLNYVVMELVNLILFYIILMLVRYFINRLMIIFLLFYDV